MAYLPRELKRLAIKNPVWLLWRAARPRSQGAGPAPPAHPLPARRAGAPRLRSPTSIPSRCGARRARGARGARAFGSTAGDGKPRPARARGHLSRSAKATSVLLGHALPRARGDFKQPRCPDLPALPKGGPVLVAAGGTARPRHDVQTQKRGFDPSDRHGHSRGASGAAPARTRASPLWHSNRPAPGDNPDPPPLAFPALRYTQMNYPAELRL